MVDKDILFTIGDVVLNDNPSEFFSNKLYQSSHFFLLSIMYESWVWMHTPTKQKKKLM